MSKSGPSVLVIGAGIIGAAAAYALQKAGARVTVLDEDGATATSASFGWINASFHHDAAHFHLRRSGLEAWARLGEAVSLPLRWQGTLCWEEEGAAFDTQRDHLAALGYGVDVVDAATFAKLEPHVAAPPERALHFKQEAALNSVIAADALLSAAMAAGAQRLRGLHVAQLVEEGGRVTGVETQAGVTRAEHVLIAAGTGSEALMAQAGSPMPMVRRPALVLRTRPVRPVLSHVLVTKFGELRQLEDGSLLMPAAVDHQGDTSEELHATLEETADDVMTRLRALLPDVALEWEELTLAFRPVPQDGLPVIGAVREGLHVACMHSGITLAAVAGELVALEMLEGVSNESGALLAPYRPARFAG